MSWRLTAILSTVAVLMIGYATIFGEKAPRASQIGKKTGDFSSLVGKLSPDFSLKDRRGKLFRLSNQRGKKVVLFFNEGIMCYPACWNQVAALGTDARLNTDKVVTASIVVDQPEQWDKAIKQMPELDRGTILFDNDRSVSSLYGTLSLESSMHRGAMPGHTYVVVDKNGTISYTKDDPQMGIRNDEIIKEVEKI